MSLRWQDFFDYVLPLVRATPRRDQKIVFDLPGLEYYRTTFVDFE